MFERYSERARRTIFHAKYEALSRSSREIEPRDIVLGLTRDEHQPNCPFAMLYEHALELRALVSPEPPLYGPPENWDVPLSKEGELALIYADKESELDGRYTIGSHHLLRGVLRAGGDTAIKMTQAGYSISSMRQASQALYRLTPNIVSSAKPKLRWRIRRHRLRLLLLAASLYVVADLIYVHWSR